MKISSQEIARYAGVSLATVSRMLNSSGYVKKETKEKIKIAIQKIKDEKRIFNIEERVGTIAVLIPDITNIFFVNAIEGIEKVCFKKGYIPMIFNSRDSEEIESVILKGLKKMKISGLIISPIGDDNDVNIIDYERLLEGLKVPIILLDRDLETGHYGGIFVDNIKGTSEAIKKFIDIGHKKIAIIAGLKKSKSGKERYMGYEKTMKINNIDIHTEYVKYGDYRKESGYRITRELLELEIPPTAIFVGNNLMCYGALKAIKEKNLIVGKDISIISFDDLEIDIFGESNISCISVNTIEMGKIAGKLVIEKIEGNMQYGHSDRKIILKTELKLKGSENFKNKK